eukprot:723622_1
MSERQPVYLVLNAIMWIYAIIGIYDFHNDAVHYALNSLSITSFSKYQALQQQLDDALHRNASLEQICQVKFDKLHDQLQTLQSKQTQPTEDKSKHRTGPLAYYFGMSIACAGTAFVGILTTRICYLALTGRRNEINNIMR